MVQIRWVPSHLKVPENDGVDELARQGRLLHPNNLLPLSKRGHVFEWDALGLELMPETEAAEQAWDVDSGGESIDVQEPFWSDGDAYSMDFSDTRLRVHLDCDNEGLSTDVSEPGRKRNRGRLGRCITGGGPSGIVSVTGQEGNQAKS